MRHGNAIDKKLVRQETAKAEAWCAGRSGGTVTLNFGIGTAAENRRVMGTALKSIKK